MADANRAVGAPGCLEGKVAARRAVSRLLDAEPVGKIDQGPVAGMPDAVAGIVGPYHAHAGLVVVPQRLCCSVAPGFVAKPHAFADRTGGAGDGKAGRPTQVPSVSGPASRYWEA